MPVAPARRRRLGYRDGGVLVAIGGAFVTVGALVPWAETTAYLGNSIPPKTVGHSGFEVTPILAVVTLASGAAGLIYGLLVARRGANPFPMLAAAGLAVVSYFAGYAVAGPWAKDFVRSAGFGRLLDNGVLSAGVSVWFVLFVGAGTVLMAWGSILAALRYHEW